jgi:hypothetical protein
MPCRLSSDIHVNGQRMVGFEMRGMDNGAAVVGNPEGSKTKRSRLMFAEGREIMGPEYSVHAGINIRETAGNET